MNITIDTTLKQIKLNQDITFNDLLMGLDGLISPSINWRSDYTITQNSYSIYSYPAQPSNVTFTTSSND